jgi:SAM-dependent methyltransferase
MGLGSNVLDDITHRAVLPAERSPSPSGQLSYTDDLTLPLLAGGTGEDQHSPSAPAGRREAEGADSQPRGGGIPAVGAAAVDAITLLCSASEKMGGDGSMISSDVWDEEAASRYDAETAGMATDEALRPTLDLLADLADGGRVPEFAIGTGRVGVPLMRRGVDVAGVELSAPMVAQLRKKATARELPVVIGDMATAEVPGQFTLVVLVFNTIGNLCTQQEQVQCFANAARHLAPGGRFIIEVGVPPLRRLPPGQDAVPFDLSAEHVGFDTFDLVTQRAVSHHYRLDDGTFRYSPHNYRFVWPSELDLMARLAGMTLEHRWEDWSRAPFTADSERHISVWRLPAGW